MPPHLSAELRTYCQAGILGPVHFAGFIDNGFEGRIVFESRADEVAPIHPRAQTVVTKMDVYRTGKPDKLYGTESGSHYQGQSGPRVSKHFKVFDMAFAARNYAKLEKEVLVQDARLLTSIRSQKEEFLFHNEEELQHLVSLAEKGFFVSRYECDRPGSREPLALQIIPYAVLFDDTNRVFCYVRASNIKDYGEKELFGKHSIGIGGHIIRRDSPGLLVSGLERELKEEVHITGYDAPVLIGSVHSNEKPVDSRHFGPVYGVHVKSPVVIAEASAISGRMLSVPELLEDVKHTGKYETWSRLIIPHLNEILTRTRQKTRML